ncbi:hypothetical protein V5F59_05290 [Xanthobacter autotrophicus DSM 431]|uniref:hypothetical protein n=1 Tax=Xanthobacter nonsaccharivorans TaxID=3119912 RepID=UPI00372C4AED
MNSAEGGASYSYLPRLGGAGVRLTLGPGVLLFAVGAKEGRLSLADIIEVRLRFQAAKFAGTAFEMELRGRDGTQLKIGSASRTSLTAVRDQGSAYAAFVRAFHAARGGAGGECRYIGGFPAWRFRLMAVLGVATVAGLVAVIGFALSERQWNAAVLLAALSAALAWPTGQMVWRNRPVRYRPEAVPAHLLPA